MPLRQSAIKALPVAHYSQESHLAIVRSGWFFLRLCVRFVSALASIETSIPLHVRYGCASYLFEPQPAWLS